MLNETKLVSMPKIIYFAVITFLLCFNTVNGQKQNLSSKEKIAAVFEDYFDLEREAIHLHLNKTIFINNETIWFKGYVINRKTGKPFFTTNLFVLLFDEKGNQLSEQLVFGNSGSFQGKIKLNSNYKSGNYYIQAYTNWMNNFSENESTLTKINIIHPEEGYKDYKTVNGETLSISLHPEGGKFIKEVNNNLGVQVKDCRGNTVPNLEGTVQTLNGEILKTFTLNQFGLGKVEIIPTNQELKIVIPVENKMLEANLPSSTYEGFSLVVNNFSIANKTIIDIRTNEQTVSSLKNKKIFLVINQDDKTIIEELVFNSNYEKIIRLENKNFFNGINTISIIDEDLKKWCNRFIYNKKTNENEMNLMKSTSNGLSLNFAGYSNCINSNLSISVLPESTKSLTLKTPIHAGLLINPYLYRNLENASYYFKNSNRLKMYELDLALLHQETEKYDFSYMILHPPNSIYSFDVGLEIKGKIDTKIPNKTFTKVKLKSLKDMIMAQSDVNENGDYTIKHLVIADSTFVTMTLERLPDFEKIVTKLDPKVFNRNRPFNSPFKLNIAPECSIENSISLDSLELPKFKGKSIQLKEVIVKNAAQKKKLTYENEFGNFNLRGYKIDDTLNNNPSVLYFIESKGFYVIRNLTNGTFTISSSRMPTTINGAQSTTQVFINNRLLFSYDELDVMRMDEIDEIYLDRFAIVPSVQNYQGVIKIYLKKAYSYDSKGVDPNRFYIKDGFKRFVDYEKEEVLSTQNRGFDNFGIMNWYPVKLSDETGQFEIEITNLNKNSAKIIIEGLNNEGEIVGKEINLKL